jgi:hypothetical protein
LAKLFPLILFAFLVASSRAADISLFAPSNFTIYSAPQNVSVNAVVYTGGITPVGYFGAGQQTTGSVTALYGWNVSTTFNATHFNVTKQASCTATTAYLMFGNKSSYLSNVTFTGNTAFINYPIAANTAYWIYTGSGGSSYTYTVAPFINLPDTQNGVTILCLDSIAGGAKCSSTSEYVPNIQNLTFAKNATSSALQNFSVNWSYANATLYNSSLVLSLDFDNVAVLGENQSHVVDNSLYANNGTWLGDSFNNGVLVGSPSWVTGTFGGGLQFNGSNYVNLGTSALFDSLNNTATTISFWANLSTYAGNPYIISKGTAARWMIQAIGSTLSMQVYDGTKHHEGVSSGAITLNEMAYFTCIIYHSSVGNITCYKNGVVLANAQTGDAMETVGATTNANNLQIGGSDLGSLLSGIVGSVRVWSRALSASEVAVEMNSSRPVSGYGLVGDWEFEDGSGSVAQDTHNFVVGKYEGAGNFNGSNYVNVTLSTTFNASKPMTFSAWVKTNVTGGQEILSSFLPSGAFPGWSIVLSRAVAGQIEFYDGNGFIASSSTGWLDNTWHQLVVTTNSTRITFYKDGLLTDSQARADPNKAYSGYELHVGASTNSSVNRFFNGSIDAVRIWNISLSAGEISQQYLGNLAKYNANQWWYNSTQQITALGRYPFLSSACDLVSCQTQQRDWYYGGYTNLSIFDEATSLPLVATASFANSTTTNAFVTSKSWLFYDQLPTGLVTLSVSNGTAYPARSYSLVITNLTRQDVSVYLAAASSAQYVLFQVQTNSGQPIQGAYANVTRVTSGVTTTLSTGFTDSTGAVSFFLVPNTPYTIYFSAAGYASQAVTVSSAANQFMIRLLPTNNSIIIVPPLQNVTWGFTPAGSNINYSNSNQTINFTVIDTSNNLSWFAVAFYYNGTLLYSANTSGAPSGGSITYSVNTSYLANLNNTYPQLSAYAWIQENGASLANTSKRWLITNPAQGAYTAQTALTQLLNNQGLRLFLVIIGLIAIAKITAMVSGDSVFGVISALIALGVFMFAGILSNNNLPDWPTYALISLVGLSLFLLRSGL